LQLRTISGVLEDLRGPEDKLAQLKTAFAELLLCGETLGVGGEVPLQVSPAELATFEGQMRVGPPAVRGDDRVSVREQLLGVVLVTVSGNVEVGVALIEHAPQSPTLTGGPPAGLIHVHGARVTKLPE